MQMEKRSDILSRHLSVYGTIVSENSQYCPGSVYKKTSGGKLERDVVGYNPERKLLMKFERIDEKTVRCFLSNEELEGYQIDYKDFVLRSERAREVVRAIIEQAAAEVGYKPPRFAFDMSIMLMPDQGMVLTFSESDPLDEKNGGRLMDYLREMKKAIDQAAEEHKKGKASKTKKEEQDDELQPEQGIFVFDNLRTVIELAQVLPSKLRVRSELYRMDGRYYLYLHKGGAAYDRYNKLCIHTLEYADLYGADQEKYLFLREHGECLIADRALAKLHTKKK